MANKNICPICGSDKLTDFFTVKNIPVHVCVLFDSQEDAQKASKGDIVLTYCHGCGFIFNRVFDPTLISFEPGYESSLFYSNKFRSYIQELAERLIEKYKICGKTVLEIGCGAGDFLRLMCGLGKNFGIGIDPTVKEEEEKTIDGGKVRFIRDYFSERYTSLDSDFICCLSVFEDIPDPLGFLKILSTMTDDHPDTAIYFEVPNSAYTFSNLSAWGIYYEQHSHFTETSLAQTFLQSGFKIIEAGGCYDDDQYVYVEAVSGKTPSTNGFKRTGALTLPNDLQKFSSRHLKNVSIWHNRLCDMKHAGKRVVAWGSGGKGIGFLNLSDTEKIIPYIVDINPNRQHKFIPGSAQKIIPPEFLRDYQPDIIVITNPLYTQEIKQQVYDLKIKPEFLLL